MNKRIILLRHAESIEDVDPTLHNINTGRIAELTEEGKEKAHQLGKHLAAHILKTEPLLVFVSPTNRVTETWDIISTYFSFTLKVVTDHRIRNLNWGNITLENRSIIEAERYKAGVLNFTFPEGDHTPSYVKAINEFVQEVVVNLRWTNHGISTILIVTHGFALRIILKYLLKLNDEDFKWLSNPPNCYYLELLYNSSTDSFVPQKPLLKMDPL